MPKYGVQMPDAFIGKVKILPFQYGEVKTEAGRGTDTNNLHDPVTINLQLLVKQYAKISSYFKKYYKILILQCDDRKLYNTIYRNPISITRKIDSVVKSARQNGRSLDFSNLHEGVSRVSLIDFKNSSHNLGLENDPTGAKNYYFYRDFIIKRPNIEHLSYFLFPFIDTYSIEEERVKEFQGGAEIKSGYSSGMQKRKGLGLTFGKISSDIIIQNRRTIATSYTYYSTKAGKTIMGPIHQEMGGNYRPGSYYDIGEDNLMYTRKFNSKVEDHRHLEVLKKKKIDFLIATNTINNNKRVQFSTQDGANFSMNQASFSDGGDFPQYTTLSSGAKSFIFHVDFENILLNNSNYSGLMKNSVLRQTLLSNCKIKKLKIYRKRVFGKANRETLMDDGRDFEDFHCSGLTSNVVPSDRPLEELVAETEDISFDSLNKRTRTSITRKPEEQSKAAGTIREIRVDYSLMRSTDQSSTIEGSRNIRSFEVVDLGFTELNSGKYRYRVEVELLDGVKNLIFSSIGVLAQKRQEFANYIYNVESIPAYYDPHARKFTTAFRKYWKSVYGAHSALPKKMRPPNVGIVYQYFKFMSLFLNDTDISNNAIRAMLMMTSHKHGSMDGLYKALEMVDTVLKQANNGLSFVQQDKLVESQVFGVDTEPGLIVVSTLLPHVNDATATGKSGLIYISDYATTNTTARIGSIDYQALDGHFSRQHTKYFKNPRKKGAINNIITPMTLVDSGGQSFNLLNVTNQQKVYMPQVFKYNIDRKLQGAPQTTSFRTSSSRALTVNENAYSILLNGVFPHDKSVLVEQHVREHCDTNKFNSHELPRIKTFRLDNQANREISSSEYLGRPRDTTLESCHDLTELLEDYGLASDILSGLKITQNFDDILNYLISVVSGNKKTFFTSLEIARIAGTGQNNPMSTHLIDPSNVKKLWDPADPADKLKEIYVFRGFEKSSDERVMINKQNWAPIQATKISRLPGSQLLCKLVDPLFYKDMQEYEMSDYPVIGDMFILTVPTDDRDRKRYFKEKSVTSRIDSISSVVSKGTDRPEFLTASPRQAQIHRLGPIRYRTRNIRSTTLKLPQRQAVGSSAPRAASSSGGSGASGGGTGGGGGGY